MRHALIPVVCFALSLPQAAQTEPPRSKTARVSSVRHWSLTDMTRIAVEVTGEFTFKTDRLASPERLFFDIAGAVSGMPTKGIHAIPVTDPLIRQIRVGENQRRVTRVVLDLKQPVEFSAAMVKNPHRLMIELRPAGQARELPEITEAPPARPERVAAKGTMPEEMSAADLAAAELATLTATAAAAEPEPAATPAPTPPVATAARLPKNGNSLIRALGLKLGRVVIDPGHGGHDHGSTGKKGVVEKELTLDLAKRVGALIEERLGAEVVYTRSEDAFVPLEARTAMANDRKADLFLSIHANSSPYASVSGVETYYLNLTTSRAELQIAARENATSNKSIHELTDIIQKITLNDKILESREFATSVQNALYQMARKSNPKARNRGVKKAPFVVLLGATMPSVLVEIGFVSNPAEEALLAKASHRQTLAEALYQGVAKYAETLSHYEVANAADAR
ncbi:MAG: N-acetylmuramoyl-L-alanine amidase [Bryobacterales bacterium]|nr:N-acetylmuramoyl-L-alanine amidase [Bryobacterales bacterium]